MVRPIDGALIPIGPTVGDNDLGRNAFASLSEVNTKNLNYFNFFHGYDLLNEENMYNKLYNLTGYEIEIYGINHGYYGYFQRNEMLTWMEDILQKDPNSFKIAFYHHPIFPGCPDHVPQYDEIDSSRKLRKIFAKFGVDAAFEHHENLYKITNSMRDKAVVEDGKGTQYFGGGNWGSPKSKCDLNNIELPYYIHKLSKENHVFLLNIRADRGLITKEIQSITSTGKILDTFTFK